MVYFSPLSVEEDVVPILDGSTVPCVVNEAFDLQVLALQDLAAGRDEVSRRCRGLRLSLGIALLEVGREARLERGGLGRAAAAQGGDDSEHSFCLQRDGLDCRVSRSTTRQKV